MLRLTCLIALLIAMSSAVSAKPNIIVILTDDQAEDLTMGLLPDGSPILPNVKSLIVDQGVRFVNSFADFPLCCPYRASLLTGLAAHNHGVKENKYGWQAYRSHEPNSLPVWMQAAGYRTALFGKYVNDFGLEKGHADKASTVSAPPGWNEWFVLYGKGKESTKGDNGYLN